MIKGSCIAAFALLMHTVIGVDYELPTTGKFFYSDFMLD